MNPSIVTILIILINGSVSLTPEDYVHLILDVHKFSNSLSVTVMHFIDDENLLQKNFIFNIQFQLLRNNIMATTVSSEKLFSLSDERFHHFNGALRRNARSLCVLFITSKRNLPKLHESSEFFTQNGIIDFVIFVRTDEPPLLQFCMNPDANSFFLKKGTSLLVKCYEDTSIQDWYFPNKNKMEIHKIASLDPNTGLINSKKLVLRNRDKLDGKVLVSAIMKDANAEKYFNNLYLALEMAGNFTIKIAQMEPVHGALNKSTNSWSGGIGAILDEKIDFAAGLYFSTPERQAAVDYSKTLMNTEFILIIRKPRSTVSILWSAYLKPFSFRLWISLAVSLPIFQIIYLLMKTKVQNGTLLPNDFLRMYGIFCQQSFPEFPKVSSLKMFYLSNFVFTFFIFSIYSASFVSKLSITDENLPFNSVEEFGRVKSHKLAVLNGLVHRGLILSSKVSQWKEAAKLLIPESEAPNNYEEAMKMVCRENMAFFIDEDFQRLPYNKTKQKCPLTIIHTGLVLSRSMVLSKNGPYTRALNHVLTRLETSGVLHSIKSKFFIFDQRVHSESSGTFTNVTIFDILVLSVMLLGNVLLSWIILFFEKLYFSIYEKTTVRSVLLHRPAAARYRKPVKKIMRKNPYKYWN